MSRNACNGENGEKLPASGDLNWMPKEAPWRLAILAKLAKLAFLAKIARRQPRPQGLSLKKWVGTHFLRERPWGRGCQNSFTLTTTLKELYMVRIE